MYYNNKIDLVGVLATDEEVQEQTGMRDSSSVFVNQKSGHIHYYIKLISQGAKLDTNQTSNNLFMGYLSCMDGYEDRDDSSEPDLIRVEKFKQTFEKFAFIFTYTKPRGEAMFCKVEKAYLVKKKERNEDDLEPHISVPVFSPREDTKAWEKGKHTPLYRHYDTYEEFMDKINANKPIGNVEKYHAKDTSPKVIIWRDDRRTVAIGLFDNSQYDREGYHLANKELAVVPISDQTMDEMIYNTDCNPTLLHVPVTIYQELYEELTYKLRTDTVAISSQTPIQEEPIEEDPIEEGQGQKNDQAVIDSFKYHSQKANLFYEIDDLINFHTAVKTGSLVILSGMSGTGKSRIVEMYGKALGIETDIIPVRPSWNDDSDLLGYLDLIHKFYRPSDTGFIKILTDAAKYPDKLYLICLDEMNLARVEHYFSQFLSILEKPEGERKLRLYDEGLEQSLFNKDEYKSEIEIGTNIRFMGTVNIDESTYHFSDKVLDRANVITLNVVDFSKEWVVEDHEPMPQLHWSVKDFNKIVSKKDIQVNPEHRAFLWELHKMLDSYCVGLGVGPRIVNQIELYINNLPKTGESYDIPVGRAFDLQIKQRILTKIRGGEEQLGKLLGQEGAGEDEACIMDLFDQFKTVSDFGLCRKIVTKKRKELSIYGYCF